MTVAQHLLQLKEDLDRVYQTGMERSRQAFADSYQEQGNQTNYYQKFSHSSWSDETFTYIRYPIVCKGDSSNGSNVFNRSWVKHIHVPVILEGVPAQETFYYATLLEEISKLVLINVPGFTRTFQGCTKLRHMPVEGSIDASFNIASAAELDEESRQSIISCLKDLTGKEQQTLTFHAAAGEKLTPEQKVTVTEKNWELVY